jgi:16S rRNA (uracil1498-N3)-methyltransferase
MPGDQVRVFDGQGREYLTTIREIKDQRVLVAIEGEPDPGSIVNREPPLELILCQSIPKGDKMELIIQKGTELGASRFIPLMTERTIVRLETGRAENRQQRWQKVAVEAARQCRRSVVPRVEGVSSLAQVLNSIPAGSLGLIPWEDEFTCAMKDVLRKEPAVPGAVWVFIGPEGGFSEEEIAKARQAGVIPVSLGPRILRTETAGLAVLTMLLYEWGDLGGAGG